MRNQSNFKVLMIMSKPNKNIRKRQKLRSWNSNYFDERKDKKKDKVRMEKKFNKDLYTKD